MIKNKNIILRVSEEFRELLEQVGIPISEYLRKSVMNSEIVKHVSKEIDPQVRYSFFQACNNLNQLAKATNILVKRDQIDRNFQTEILENLYKNEKLLNQIYNLLKEPK